MTKLVEELLMLAKIDANQIILNMEKIDLSSICSNTVDKFFIKMKEKEIYLETDINQNVFIRGDSFRIIQLITIFIDNAIKYTPSGGRIFISLKREKSIARLIIEDNGIGIGEFDKERIFDRFYRADKARHREEGGTGLGLSIAKWIVDNHKGSILVKNGREKGTKFVIEIPINI
jgi:signal transduction histidine kinase